MQKYLARKYHPVQLQTRPELIPCSHHLNNPKNLNNPNHEFKS